jgi:hypothetical protein
MIWITHQKRKEPIFFFGASFLTMATKKNLRQSVQAIVFRNLCKNHHVSRKKNSQKSSYLDHEFLEVDRTKRDPKNSYFAGLPLARFGSFLLWMITHPPTFVGTFRV